ncbi:CHAD domain-containing protein [Arthrobacter sp. ISL-72]|uniref:CHAD domain-containing protein n=1 Tax=Arthrobacter sp. ISL-72 TaxID=2819114 RepID=UPI001BE6C9CA|nr:CHAD domain-containing protein [Arthrobacter sp. ISL-72]MBT2596722.1 CHAD domain-containing protein [Arthrobacter sp. ISL-72]
MPTTAGEVLTNYLAEQFAELKHQEPLVRENQPDAVHQMRMSVRRLRSLLATAKKLLDEEVVTDVRAELKWLSGVLGSARDPEVLRERLGELLSEEPDALVFGPAARRIDEILDAASAAGRQATLEALDSDRYAALASRLAELAAAPPLAGKASRPPRKTMLKLVAKDAARVQRMVGKLEDNSDGGSPGTSPGHQGSGGQQAFGQPGSGQQGSGQHASGHNAPAHLGSAHDVGLHEVRKAAKRLRYAAEAAEPVAGKKAAKMAKRAHKVQKLLGLHQDSVVARAQLADLGGRAFRSGDSGFTYGRLHAREEGLADLSEAKFWKAWKKFPRT